MSNDNLASLYRLINAAGTHGISDIHIQPDKGTWFQTEGVLQKDSSPQSFMPQETLLDWLGSAGVTGQNAEQRLADVGQVSVAYDTGSFRSRAAFRRDTSGVSATFRVIPHVIPTPEEVSVPKVVQELMNRPSGLILIEGPTNSGKTTSIAALVEKLNIESDRHIYLIEDPIEFVHEAQGSTVLTQREIGVHARDFGSAIENALRSSPHVIVIGEMLNNETKKAVLLAATTGHLVITTAHAGSVVEAIESFIGEFPAAEQPQVRSRLSQSLLSVMTQRLLPGTDKHRVAVHEVMLVDNDLQALIRDSDLHMLYGQLESSRNAFSLEQSLADLVHAGRITLETALLESRRPDELQEKLRQMGNRS